MLLDALFAEMTKGEQIILLQLLSNHTSQNGLVIWDELGLTLFLALLFGELLLFELVQSCRGASLMHKTLRQ